MKAILNYPGAKWGMAKTIASLLPQHRSYLEPFFGSGAVLFNKKPSAIETVNDIDGDIVNFFRIIKESPEQLAKEVSFIPYSRAVFDDAHENRGETPLDKAVRFAIRSKMGHGFKTYEKTGFKIDVYARERSYCVNTWNAMPQLILDAAARLKQVQIESRPAIDLIKKFDYENVAMYIDPPYLLSTRRGKQYRCEMSEQDHVDLLEVLKKSKAKVILSGYHSELYDYELRAWKTIEIQRYNQNGEARTEVLWLNFAKEEQISLYQSQEGGEV